MISAVKPSITSESNGDEGYSTGKSRFARIRTGGPSGGLPACENSDHLFRMQCHLRFFATVVYNNDNGETGNLPMVCTPSSIFLVISRRRWQCAYVFFGLLNSGP